MVNKLLLLILIPCIMQVMGQSHILYHFDNESGLPSNLTKAITIDNQGLIWIATDGGLVRFDGNEFKGFDDKIFARFIKSVAPHPKFGLLIASDDGLGAAEPANFSMGYNVLVKSLHTYNDSLLYYPKTLYVSQDKGVWVSDISGVGKYHNSSFVKYNFDHPYHSNSFFRSFSFGEILGTLYITSWQGYAFYWDEAADKFVQITLPADRQKKIIHTAMATGDSLLLGMEDGIFLLRFDSSHRIITKKRINSVSSISSISKDSSGNFYFGSYDEGLFRISNGETVSMGLDYPALAGNSVKDIIVDLNDNIWIATDEGVFYLKKKFFINITDQRSEKRKIMGPKQIFSDNFGKIYYADNEGVYNTELVGNQISTKRVLRIDGKSLLYAAPVSESQILVSFTDKSLVRYDINTGIILSRTELSDDHFYSVYSDSKGTAWAFLARARGIISLEKSGRRKIYPVDFDDVSFVNKIYETPAGEIIAAANADKNFLLRVNRNLGSVESLSADFQNEYTSFNALDISLYPDGYIVATDRGLLKLTKDLSLSGFLSRESGILPKTIYYTKQGSIWLGSERGVYVYVDNDSIFFDRHSGLQNSSIIPGGILQDKAGNIWVATDGGVSVLPALSKVWKKSGKPILLGVEYKQKNGEVRGDTTNEYPAGSSLTLIYCSPGYPADQVKYRVRISGSDKTWIYPKIPGIAILQSLSAGTYTAEICAKEAGRLWSEPVSYQFSVIQPWYQLPQTIVLFVLILIVVIVLGTNAFISYRIKTLEKNRQLLQDKVEQRTRALQKAKKEVEKLLTETITSKSELEFVNNQLKRLLSIAAHDLKSPLQSILGLSNLMQEEEDRETVVQFSTMIYKSSVKMIQQIDELLTTSVFDTKKGQLHNDIFAVSDVIYEVVEANRPRADQKKQKLTATVEETPEILSSRDWLYRIFDNLLNNAIKYSPHEKAIDISSRVEDNSIVVRIIDEGPGFSEADFELMFVRFSRLSAKPTDGEISTGLGLSLVKEMIESLGGTVSAANRDTGGAVFTVILPLKTFLAPL